MTVCPTPTIFSKKIGLAASRNRNKFRLSSAIKQTYPPTKVKFSSVSVYTKARKTSRYTTKIVKPVYRALSGLNLTTGISLYGVTFLTSPEVAVNSFFHSSPVFGIKLLTPIIAAGESRTLLLPNCKTPLTATSPRGIIGGNGIFPGSVEFLDFVLFTSLKNFYKNYILTFASTFDFKLPILSQAASPSTDPFKELFFLRRSSKSRLTEPYNPLFAAAFSRNITLFSAPDSSPVGMFFPGSSFFLKNLLKLPVVGLFAEESTRSVFFEKISPNRVLHGRKFIRRRKRLIKRSRRHVSSFRRLNIKFLRRDISATLRFFFLKFSKLKISSRLRINVFSKGLFSVLPKPRSVRSAMGSFFPKKLILGDAPLYSTSLITNLIPSRLQLHTVVCLLKSPILLKSFVGVSGNQSPLLRVLADYSFFSKNAIISNLTPNKAFNYIFAKKIQNSAVHSHFASKVIPWYYDNIVRLGEFMFGRKIIFQFYPFMAQQVADSFAVRYKFWLPRMAYYERKLGHRFFLEEAVHILHLGFFLRDPNIISGWLKSMILRISFWRTRSIFRFLRYVLYNYFISIFSELGVKGLKIKLKGKISAAGNSRKRTILYRIGETSHSKVDLRVLHEAKTIGTFTGVMGFQVWLFY